MITSFMPITVIVSRPMLSILGRCITMFGNYEMIYTIVSTSTSLSCKVSAMTVLKGSVQTRYEIANESISTFSGIVTGTIGEYFVSDFADPIYIQSRTSLRALTRCEGSDYLRLIMEMITKVRDLQIL